MMDELAIRIISDRPELVEDKVNELAGSYAPIIWNIAPVGSGVIVTVVLLHERELRKQSLAQAMNRPMNMRPV